MTARNVQSSLHLLQRYFVKDTTRMSCVFNRSSRQKQRSVPEMIDENSSVSLINVPFKKQFEDKFGFTTSASRYFYTISPSFFKGSGLVRINLLIQLILDSTLVKRKQKTPIIMRLVVSKYRKKKPTRNEVVQSKYNFSFSLSVPYKLAK